MENLNYLELLKEAGFDDPYETCINVHTRNFDYNLAFIEFETKGELGILVTDEYGREKLKILNKYYIEAVEIVYQDDISFEELGKSNTDKMFC